MKKRVKNTMMVRRYYASGIPMYRHRNTPVEVTAGTMVNIVLVKTQLSICEMKIDKKNTIVVAVPNDNFMGEKVTREKAAKKATRKVKAVAVENPTPTVAPEVVPVVDTAPTTENIPTETPATEVPTETVQAEQPVETVAV